MFTVNESTTRKVDFKKVSLCEDGKIVDENGIMINLMDALRVAFGDRLIDISVVSKDSDKIPMDENDTESY